MTNKEKINSSNTKQLALFLSQLTECSRCFLMVECLKWQKECRKVFEQWLESEV